MEIGLDAQWPNSTTVDIFKNANITISTTGNLLWSKTQAEPFGNVVIGERQHLALKNLISVGINPVLQIFDTPEWARQNTSPSDDSFSVVKGAGYFYDYLEKVLDIYPEIKFVQIYNEVDAPKGIETYFGGWGINYLGKYLELLRGIQPLRKERGLRIGISLMFNKDLYPFSQMFVKRMGNQLIDWVGFHYYAHWMDGWDNTQLSYYVQDLLATVSRVKTIYGARKPIWLSETNTTMLKGQVGSDSFEEYKRAWIEKIVPKLARRDISKVIPYSWRSGWMGADYAKVVDGQYVPLPAFEQLKTLCGIYN